MRLKKIKDKVLKTKTNLFISLAITCSILVIILDFFDNNFKYHDILVEFHGLIFDLFVLGIVLTIYESINSKKDEIEKYQNELSDYKFWKTEESMFRTRGLIKRLVNLGVKVLDLSFCYLATDKSLSAYKNMQNWKFTGATLNDTLFLMSDMTKSNFYISNLQDASFVSVNLTECEFGGTNLVNTKFEKCNLTEVRFENAIILNRNWFDELEEAENLQVHELINKYKIVEYNQRENQIQLYKIIKK